MVENHEVAIHKQITEKNHIFRKQNHKSLHECIPDMLIYKFYNKNIKIETILNEKIAKY